MIWRLTQGWVVISLIIYWRQVGLGLTRRKRKGNIPEFVRNREWNWSYKFPSTPPKRIASSNRTVQSGESSHRSCPARRQLWMWGRNRWFLCSSCSKEWSGIRQRLLAGVTIPVGCGTVHSKKRLAQKWMDAVKSIGLTSIMKVVETYLLSIFHDRELKAHGRKVLLVTWYLKPYSIGPAQDRTHESGLNRSQPVWILSQSFQLFTLTIPVIGSNLIFPNWIIDG